MRMPVVPESRINSELNLIGGSSKNETALAKVAAAATIEDI